MISAVVLAAGKSRRMCEQKLLLPLGEGTVISCIVDEVLAGPVDEVLVVVGNDREGIEQALAGRRVKFVDNPDADGDMLSSVRCGLTALGQSEGILVVLGDQPGISRHVVTELIRTFGGAGGQIIVPTFQGKRGHPLLFSVSYREEILRSFDEVGLRGLLQAHPEAVREVEVCSAEVLENMNLPDDYRRILGTYPKDHE
jgi:molybdenum cofactor cytidylyltransferase